MRPHEDGNYTIEEQLSMPDMTKIVGGKVTYGLTVCPKQYESKRADVELTFTVGVDDDYEAIFDRASRAVINRARIMCDLPELKAAPKTEPRITTASGPTNQGLFD